MDAATDNADADAPQPPGGDREIPELAAVPLESARLAWRILPKAALLALAGWLSISAVGCLVGGIAGSLFDPVAILENTSETAQTTYMVLGAAAGLVAACVVHAVRLGIYAYLHSEYAGRTDDSPVAFVSRLFPASVAFAVKVLGAAVPAAGVGWAMIALEPWMPKVATVPVVAAVGLGLYVRLHFADLAVFLDGVGPDEGLRRAWRRTASPSAYITVAGLILALNALAGAVCLVGIAPYWLASTAGELGAVDSAACGSVALIGIHLAVLYALSGNYLLYLRYSAVER